MSGCCIFGCQNRYSTGKLKFYRIPTGSRPFQSNRRRLWLEAIKRTDWTEDTIKNARVCSAHFISGEASLDSSCRDFVPSVFVYSKLSQKPEAKMERYHKKRKRDDMVNNPANQHRPSETPDQECSMDYYLAKQPATDHNYARNCVGDTAAAAKTIRQLEAKIRSLENQLGDTSFTLHINRYCATDEEFRFYTRFPSETVFWEFWESVAPSASRLAYWARAQRASDAMALEKPSPNRRLALEDELFLYCCRVAVGMKEKVIANIFGVSTTTVSRVIITWANYLFLVLGSAPLWMTREQVQATVPLKFAQYCPNVRVILDCTEIRCEAPSSLTLQSGTFSSYMNRNTFKGLIGIAPCGVITFASKLFTGSISDREIIRQSGILRLLEPGDVCMAGKGFIIDQMLSEFGATLVIPPFKRGSRFSREDAEKTLNIARHWILVERAIRRVKEYHIWDTTVPLTLSGSVNQLWANSCMMSNYQGPLDVKDDVPV